MDAQRDAGLLAQGKRTDLGCKKTQVDKATLAESGIDKNLADTARKLAAIPAQEFEGIVGDWREKLRAQLRHVLWWDENVGVGHGAGRGNKKNSDLRSFLSVEEAENLTGISMLQTSRWRRKLTPEKKFEESEGDQRSARGDPPSLGRTVWVFPQPALQ